MISLQGFAKIFPDPACAGCGSDLAVEFNPWFPWIAQHKAECAKFGDDTPPRIPGVRSMDMATCLACDYRPLIPKCFPSEPVHSSMGRPYWGWWYDPDLPETSGEAYGFMVHSFELTEPRLLSSSRAEQLRSRIPIVDGLLLGEMVIEAMGADPTSTKFLMAQAKRRLESFGTCCRARMEVFENCQTKDGVSGLRYLQGVTEFNVVELDNDAAFAPTSTMFSVVFSASTLVDTPEARLVADTVFDEGTALLFNTCPTDVEPVTTFVPKQVCTVDLELDTAGVLNVCKVDFETFDPDECFMDVRDVRAVDPSTIVACPIQVDLDLTQSPPILTAVQPSLFAEKVTDVLAAGGTIDGTSNPIVVRRLTIENNDYRPGSSSCPDEIRAAGCATGAGLTVTDGVIDWAASGVDTTVTYLWDGVATPAAALVKIMDYWTCMGTRGEAGAIGGAVAGNFASILSRMQEAFDDEFPSDTNDPVELALLLDDSGEPTIRARNSSGGTINIDYTFRVASFPGDSGANLIVDPSDAAGAPQECLPTFTGSPIGTGPCVQITIAADGSITANLDPTIDDLFDARFEFGPYTEVTTPGCPSIIPVPAELNVVGDVANEVGWSAGFGWPLETTGDQYPILTVDGVPNTRDPQVITTTPAVEASTSEWSLLRVPIDGMSASLEYSSRWSLSSPFSAAIVAPFNEPYTAEGGIVHLWTGSDGDTEPTAATIRDYVCGPDNPYPGTAVGALGPGGSIVVGSNGAFYTTADSIQSGTGANLGAGWRANTLICGATKATLFVFWPTGKFAPVIDFELTPVGTP